MFHSLRAALVAAAIAALPPFAHAGPIRWGLKAESPDGTVLREVAGLTDLVYFDFFLPSAQFSGELVPDPIPDNGLVSVVRRSRANVTIFDEPSGQSDTFELYYDYVWQYERRPDGTLDPIYEGESPGRPGPGPLLLTLGGNEYAVRSLGGDLQVRVTPGEAPIATPEPGTFALGALGLCAVGAARRVRKAAAS